jgi:hypothetical protein
MKVESWSDLFKYNKELLEDDYNHGQALVLKSKTKANDNVTVRKTIKKIFHKNHEKAVLRSDS